MPNLKKHYEQNVVPRMMKRFGYKNVLQVPRLSKCVVNMGVGRASEDIKLLEDAAKDLTLICGQKPVFTRAKKSISNFKIRKGQAIGCVVTLRNRKMYEFAERLIHVALPRVRDFRGLSTRAFDSRGNYNVGIREQNIFPEVVSDKVTRIQGMNITFVIHSSNREASLYLLYLMGVPFRDKDDRLSLDEAK